MSATTRDANQEVIEEGPTRYAAFAMRLRTLITASSRYIAYSSDVGEAFRPLTNPLVVRGAYGISWAYILGDCGYAGWLAHKERQEHASLMSTVVDKTLTPVQKVELRKRQLDSEKTSPIQWNPLEASETTHVGLVVARRAVFQSLASMALPAFTIHSVVRYSAPLFAKSASKRVRAAGPTVAGLAVVPALPFMFDHPIEHVVDTAFDWIELRLAEAKAKTEETLKKKTKLSDVQEVGAKRASFLGSAAIVGVGVDLLHIPRIHTLIARQAARLRTVHRSGVRYLAAQQLARRIMHQKEYADWLSMQDSRSETALDEQVRRVATTWSVKEAAFKAISGVACPRALTWHDALLVKDAKRRPVLQYTDELKRDWQTSNVEPSRPPKLHVSISHDGEYITAFVVAEEE